MICLWKYILENNVVILQSHWICWNNARSVYRGWNVSHMKTAKSGILHLFDSAAHSLIETYQQTVH